MQIGIDIVSVRRIEEIYGRFGSRFLKRFFSEEEIKYCLARKNMVECLAGRFAAKEAFYKVLPYNLQKKFVFKEIEILVDSTGKPYYRLPSPLSVSEVALSITHEKEFAVAVCTLIRR